MNERRSLLQIGNNFEGVIIQSVASLKKSMIEVYQVENIKKNRKEILKIDQTASKRLKSEYEILIQLQNPSFPKIYSSSFEKGLDFLIHEGCYSNLNSIMKEFKILDISTTVSVFLQLINSIEIVHKKFIIHGNISSKCLLISLAKTQILLSGFTESVDLKVTSVPRPRNKNELSCSFASLNSHTGTLSYKDDLESLGYLLVYMFTGKLPWKNFFPKNTFSKWQKVFIMKRSQNIGKLCFGCPQVFITYFQYVEHLKDQDLPDYEYLKNLIGQLVESKSLRFMWDVKKCVKIRRKTSKKKEFKTMKTHKSGNESHQKEIVFRSKSDVTKYEVASNNLEFADDHEKTLENENIPEFKNRVQIMESRETLYLSLAAAQSLKPSSRTSCIII